MISEKDWGDLAQSLHDFMLLEGWGAGREILQIEEFFGVNMDGWFEEVLAL